MILWNSSYIWCYLFLKILENEILMEICLWPHLAMKGLIKYRVKFFFSPKVLEVSDQKLLVDGSESITL